MTSFTLSSMSIVENFRSAWNFAALFIVLTCPQVQAADWRELVKADVLGRWQETTGNSQNADVSFPTLSGNYRFPECDSTPEISLIRALQPGRNGAELRCASPFWSQTLALELHVFAEVVVLQQDAQHDTVLSGAATGLVTTDVAGLSQGYYTDPVQVDGMIVRRSLRAGTTLTPDMLEPADIISRGQPVTILLNRPGIRIEIKGSALADGHEGERIRVRNEQTGALLYAEVIGDGLVQVR